MLKIRLLFTLKWGWTLHSCIYQHIGGSSHTFALFYFFCWCLRINLSFCSWQCNFYIITQVQNHHLQFSASFIATNIMISIFSSGCCRIISTLSICTNVNTIDNHSSGSHVAVEFIKQSRDCYYVKVQNLLKWTTWMMMMVFLFKNYVKVYDD